MNATMIIHADRKQHRLKDMRAGVVEAEQDRERPAAGKAAPNTSAPIRIAAEMTVMTLGQTISRVEAEAGCGLMERVLIKGRNLPKRVHLSSVKGPKMPHRVI